MGRWWAEKHQHFTRSLATFEEGILGGYHHNPHISPKNTHCIIPEDSLSTMSTAASTVASTFSTTEEQERSKDRMKELKIASLPTSGEALSEWIMNLKWSLAGDCWCHDGVHATDLTKTTAATKSLSNNLLSVFKKAVTKHASSLYQQNAHSLLQDNIIGLNGTYLITQGKGFEMFHLRIKSGFSRGLGTKAILNLTEYVSALQQNQESIGVFFDRTNQLYGQVLLTKGCNIGETAQGSFTLEGLRRGAYHEALAPG
jgi:hypothetical protein